MKRFILLFAILILTACSSVAVTPYRYLPPYSGDVILFHTAPDQYEIVAFIEVVGASSLDSVMRIAKTKAAASGADGLLITKDDISRFETGQYIIKGYAIQTR